MMEFDKLPKGMKIKVNDPVEEVDEYKDLTHVEINYSKLIREALDSIPELLISVIAMHIEEEKNAYPVVTLDLVVQARSNDI